MIVSSFPTERASIARMAAFRRHGLTTNGIASKCHAQAQQEPKPSDLCFQAIRGTVFIGSHSRQATSIKMMCSSFNSTEVRNLVRQPEP